MDTCPVRFRILSRLGIIAFAAFIFLTPQTTANAQDVTPPTTTSVQTPATPDGNNDWYVTPVQFELTATDLDSGVDEIRYRIDSGIWQVVDYANTQNLVTNPSFETAGATTTGIANWEATVVDPDGVYTQDLTQYAPGYASASASIEATGGTWHGINNSLTPVPATPYDNMSASVWVKIANVPGISYFKVYALLSNGSSVQIAESDHLTGTTAGWVNLAVDFNVNEADAVGVYLDIGHTGPGFMYADAASINSSFAQTSTTLTISTDSANHRLEFYSVDNTGNAETYSCEGVIKNCIEFKLDQTPPGNWNGSGAVRGQGGSDHELFVFTNVEDVTSGLSTNTDQNQYRVDTEITFGHFENLIYCNTPWLTDDWLALEEFVTVDGVNTAFLKTQKIDFCNSDWKICKDVRFYAEDMAGNIRTKDLCLNGPWIRVTGGGAVRANFNIDMLAEPPDGESNTDGLIESGGPLIDFFTSSNNWKVINSPIPSTYGYDEILAATGSKTPMGASLLTTSGLYTVAGNFEIESGNTPATYDDAVFDQIVFIDGDLLISNDVSVGASSTALFVVSGKVEISESVENVGIAIIANGDLYTAYDLVEGRTTKTLNLDGVFSANKFWLQRTLQGTNNETTPSEEIVFEPKYLVQLKQFFPGGNVTWRYIQ